MDDLTIEVTGGIARLGMNRSEKHNALSARMISELTGAAALLGTDPEVRAVILTGQGKSFCAGADLGWMREQIEAGPTERAAEARRIALMLRALNEMPKPLIGMVQGNAFGGGIGMMSVCDTVVADEAALFGLTETRLGIIPATIGPYVIARMGEGFARRVFMSGNRFDGAKAVELGLVSSLHPAADLEAAALAEATPYLSCAPGAVAAAKALARRLGPVIDDATIDMSIAALIAQWESEEAAEGIAAFFDRRPAPWVIAP